MTPEEQLEEERKAAMATTPAPAVVPAAQPASAPQPMPATAPAIMNTQDKSTQTSTSTSTPVQTQGEKAAVANLDKVYQDAMALEAKALEVGKAKAVAEEGYAKEKLAIQEANALKRQAQEEAYNTNLTSATEDLAAKKKALDDFKFKDYFADKSHGQKALAGLAIMLGGYGAALQGSTDNKALTVVQNAIDRDFAQQRASLEKLKDSLQASRENKQQVLTDYDRAAATLNIAQANAYEKAATTLELGLKKQGVPQAEIDSNKNVLGLREKMGEKQLQVSQSLRPTVVNATNEAVQNKENIVDPSKQGVKYTEDEKKAAGFLLRMKRASKEYDANGGLSPKAADIYQKWVVQNTFEEKSPTGQIIRVFRHPGTMPEGLSEKERNALTSINDFIYADLRKESGAAIGPEEFKKYFDLFLPDKKDSQKNIEHKNKIRQTHIDAVTKGLPKSLLEDDEPVASSVPQPSFAPAAPAAARSYKDLLRKK